MKNISRIALVTSFVLAVMGAAVAMPSAPDAGSLAATAQSQDRIVRAVRHELLMLPQFGIFDNLSYRVQDGTVTLLGQVCNPVLKDEALAAVKHIEGVQQVNNEIEILPPSFSDDRIRRQVARALFKQPRLFEYSIQPVPPIHIIVKNGQVSLEGIVRNQADKDVAGIQANSVPGIFSVQNHLQVEKPKLASTDRLSGSGRAHA